VTLRAPLPLSVVSNQPKSLNASAGPCGTREPGNLLVPRPRKACLRLDVRLSSFPAICELLPKSHTQSRARFTQRASAAGSPKGPPPALASWPARSPIWVSSGEAPQAPRRRRPHPAQPPEQAQTGRRKQGADGDAGGSREAGPQFGALPRKRRNPSSRGRRPRAPRHGAVVPARCRDAPPDWMWPARWAGRCRTG
jgi:hypothetical protein